MFRIGDFSKLTQVSVRMLRYYEKKGILMPIEKDLDSKYRWYSVSQIATVNKIKTLRDLGFLVEEIKVALTLSKKDFSTLLKQQEKKLMGELRIQEHRLQRVQKLQEMISHQDIHTEYEVTIKTVPEKRVISYRQKIESYYDEGDLWRILDTYVKGISLSLDEEYSIAIFHEGEDIDVEVSYVITKEVEIDAPFTYQTLPEIKEMASILSYGSFSNIGKTYQQLATWIDKNEYAIIGEVREVAINGPWNRDNEEEYLIEIQIPVKKINND